jgi:hypothetical protein
MDIIRAIVSDPSIPERVRLTFIETVAAVAPEHLTPRLIDRQVLAAYEKHAFRPPRCFARSRFGLAPIAEDEEEEEEEEKEEDNR